MRPGQGQGRAAEAEQAWRDGIAAGDPDAPAGLASLRSGQGRVAEAEQAWRDAIAAGDPDAPAGLARMLAEQGRVAEAEQLWRAAIAVGYPKIDPLALRVHRAIPLPADRAMGRPAGGVDPRLPALGVPPGGALLVRSDGVPATAENEESRGMSTRMRDALARLMTELRHEPTAKRVRARLGDADIVDSTRALLVWEPRRISPMYAVPADEITAELTLEGPVETGGPPILHPGIPFTVHSTPGESFGVTIGGETRVGATFRPDDPELAGYVLLDFDAFEWFEEAEPIRAHPRDPYHRIDVRASRRHVRLEYKGQLIADTERATLVFENHLPTRYYMPREDVVAVLTPSDTRTYCPYKGEARYFSLPTKPDIGWSYERPLLDANQIAGLVAFYDDVMDVTVDGVQQGRSDSRFGQTLLEEFGVAEDDP